MEVWRIPFPAAVLTGLLLLFGSIPVPASEVEVGGYLSENLGLGGVGGNALDYTRAELDLALRMDIAAAADLHLFSEMLIRSVWDFPPAYEDAVDFSVFNPFDFENLMSMNVELREAYADLYGFPLPTMDVRIGRQRIPWGKADRIGVVDNLNPDDLGDFWDFGRHLPSDAVRLSCYWGLLTLEGVYIPVFKPAVLPEQASAGAASALPDISPLALNSLAVDYLLPGRDPPANGTLGFRAGANLFGWDVAMSYVFGREDFPRPESVTAVFHTPGIDVDVEMVYGYPRLHIGAAEISGDLFGLGLWGEAAFFWPDYTTVIDTSAIGGSLDVDTKEWYVKAVAGVDYTFPFGLYVNVQYAHGLAFESRRDAIQDYLILGAEWVPAGGWIKIGPIGVAFEADDFHSIADSWALALSPEISFYPADSVELTAGLHWIEARAGTTFSLQAAETELSFGGKFSF